MKVTVRVDCTPEEARRFLGLPDVGPLQEKLLEELQQRMSANLSAMSPVELLKIWLPAGRESWQDIQQALWGLAGDRGEDDGTRQQR